MVLPLSVSIILYPFLVTPLSITLYFISLLVISYGIWNTAGRSSTITYFLALLAMNLVLIFNASYVLSTFSIIFSALLYGIYLKFYAKNNIDRLLSIFKRDSFSIDSNNIPKGHETWLKHLAANDRKILWST